MAAPAPSRTRAPEIAPGLSLWLDTLPAAQRRLRPPLSGDTETDVVVVGAGFTGLWTAYYLRALAPDRRVLVLDAQHAGYGAAGRNGGWCTAEMSALLPTLARRHGPMAAVRMYRAAQRTLDEIERVLAAEGIDCGWQRDGSLYVARTPPQEARLRAWNHIRRKLGVPDLEVLDAAAARERLAVTGVLAAAYTPHCAAVHPARLARGLAEAVERRGVEVVEGTRALRIEPHRVVTDRGVVRAGVVVSATEAYTGSLGGSPRRLLPVYSRAIATAPLPGEVWERLGWPGRTTLSESRFQFAYFHRTPDDRLLVGGRGAGYAYGSRVDTALERDPAVHARQRQALADLFPALRDVEITHEWGGVYGMHRDNLPAVVFDEATGLARAGGYGGEGVALSNLAGRTLAALVAGESTPETRLCWTNHRGRRWEPEPLRFLGVRGLSGLALKADAYEDRTGRPTPGVAAAIRALM